MSSSPSIAVQPVGTAHRMVPALGRVLAACAALIGLMGVSYMARVLSELESAGAAHAGLVGQALAAQPMSLANSRQDTSVPDASRALAGRQADTAEPAPTF